MSLEADLHIQEINVTPVVAVTPLHTSALMRMYNHGLSVFSYSISNTEIINIDLTILN